MQRTNILILICSIIISGLCSHAYTQELNAVVTLSIPKLQETDPAVFKTLESDLQEFLNQERWTTDEYRLYERIDCNFQLNITQELGGNNYKADVAIKAIRPVYGSEYKTVLINYVDRDIVFTYQEFQPIENGTEFFKDNLSAVFSFYAQLILGLDNESFASGGGDDYFQRMQNIINQIPPPISETDKGWQSLNRKTTRYWMAENYLNPRFKSFREAWYNYHRKSLDIMSANPDQALITMVDALKEVDKTNSEYPNSVGVLMFISSKSDEIVDIMKNGTQAQKNTVFEIMRRLDPGSSGKYNAIRS